MALIEFKSQEGRNCHVPSEHRDFDRAFRMRSDRAEIRPEQPDDLGFLHELAMRCSPVAGILPQPVLAQQAAAQEMGHRAQYPEAMRRIVILDRIRAARIAIDWGARDISHGVDIAVLPESRPTGVALHLLRAWLDVADCGGWRCTLWVNRDNPAVRLYAYLSFRADGEQASDQASPFVRMIRPARARR